LVSGNNLLSMEFWDRQLLSWYCHQSDLTDLFPIVVRFNLYFFQTLSYIIHLGLMWNLLLLKLKS